MDNNKLKQLNEEEFWRKFIEDPTARQAATRDDLALFYTVYYLPLLAKKYNLATFHMEIMDILQASEHKYFVLEGFRGSSKTSIANIVHTVWSIVGKQQVKFVLIICQTQEQARLCLTNIKNFMLSEPLHSDMGPFKVPEGEWRLTAVDIPQYGARIAVASIDQPIRGLLHGTVRPGLVICDDLENVNSARSSDQREKLWNVVTSDVFPVGDRDTRFIMIGTRLHEESLIMRLKTQIESEERPGIFRSYPIIDEEDTILWPGKYPTMKDIMQQKAEIGNEVAWQREFLLRIIPDDFQVIYPDWIHYYDSVPEDIRNILIGVDLAISQREGADKTAIISVLGCKVGKEPVLYVLPHPVNKRLTFPDTVNEIERLNYELAAEFSVETFTFVEKVQYQEAMIQQLEYDGINVEGIRVVTDKRSRLASCANFIKNGRIVFPRQGAEELIRQVIGFGAEKFDDITDALTLIIRAFIEVLGVEPEGSVNIPIDIDPTRISNPLIYPSHDSRRLIDNERSNNGGFAEREAQRRSEYRESGSSDSSWSPGSEYGGSRPSEGSSGGSRSGESGRGGGFSNDAFGDMLGGAARRRFGP